MGINAEYMGTSVLSFGLSGVNSSNPTIIMAELGLKKKEIDAIEFAFDVYDFKGDGTVDAFYAGDLIRACNLNPTKKNVITTSTRKTLKRSLPPLLHPLTGQSWVM